ncbi:MAG: phage head-tail connector protein [Planctomycetaceae bacterium]|nr:phage head-tail connector protein [Planctomycetaceae bacterium]
MEKQIALPTKQPISLTEVKEHLRVETTDEDDLLTAYIEAATRMVEQNLNRSLVLTEYQKVFDYWPHDGGDHYSPHLSNLERNAMFLEHPPVKQVDSITYVDGDGATQTLAAADYQVDLFREPARIMPAWGKHWPTGVRYQANSITATYKAGYLIPFTVNTGTDVITTPGYSPSNGTRVRFSTSGGLLPSPLSALTDYYVVSASGTSWSVSLTEGGASVDITDAGGGLLFVGELPAVVSQALKLLIGHWFWNREAVGSAGTEIELAYGSLLNAARWTL